METAKSVHGVGYTAWSRLIDMLDGIEPLARLQSHKDTTESHKIVERCALPRYAVSYASYGAI